MIILPTFIEQKNIDLPGAILLIQATIERDKKKALNKQRIMMDRHRKRTREKKKTMKMIKKILTETMLKR